MAGLKNLREVLCAALALSVLLLAPSASAAIYMLKQPNGVIELTDRPKSKSYKLVTIGSNWRVEPRAQQANAKYFLQNRKLYGPLLSKAAYRHGVNEALLYAVVTAESAFDPHAVSRAGAVGLMQLMPGTADRYGVSDRKDPHENVQGGTAYLADLIKMFDNKLNLALAAYNAGENAVIRHGHRIPPYPETRDYVAKVLRYYDEYRKVM
jgi:soluble lytic murein transglycosylase-like protein